MADDNLPSGQKLRFDINKLEETKNPHFRHRNERGVIGNLEVYSTRVIAFLFWTYLLLSLVLVNLDGKIKEILPDRAGWVVEYKFALFLFILAAFAALVPRKKVWFYIFYIAVFPIARLVSISTRLFVMGGWPTAIAVANAIIGIFMSLKRKVVFFCLLLLGFFLTAYSQSSLVHAICLSVSIIMFAYTVITSFRASRHPSLVVSKYITFTQYLTSKGQGSFFLPPEDIRRIPFVDLDDNQRKAWVQKLELSIMFERSCLYLSQRIKEYQESEWRILPSAVSLLSVFLASLLLFGVAHHSLFSLSPNQYDLGGGAGRVFDFVYFSFGNIIFSTLSEMRAVGDISQILVMLQSTSVFLILAIVVSSYLSLRDKRYADKLSEVAGDFQAEAESMERHVQEAFGVPSIDEAIDNLRQAKSGVLDFILAVSRRLSKSR